MRIRNTAIIYYSLPGVANPKFLLESELDFYFDSDSIQEIHFRSKFYKLVVHNGKFWVNQKCYIKPKFFTFQLRYWKCLCLQTTTVHLGSANFTFDVKPPNKLRVGFQGKSLDPDLD